MINSVLNQGLAGMQSSQHKMLEAAKEIATVAAPAETPNPGMSPVQEPSGRTLREPNDLVEPLIELRRQEHLFTASAKIVSVADQTLGSLIDVTS